MRLKVTNLVLDKQLCLIFNYICICVLACSSVCHIKTESIRKLSNFNFQWQKPCTRIIETISPSFFIFLKGYRYNVICNNTKDYLSSQPKKVNVKFHKNCENTGKIVKISCVRCHFVKFDITVFIRL